MSLVAVLLGYLQFEEEAATRRRRFFLEHFHEPKPVSYLDQFHVPDQPFSIDEFGEFEFTQLFRFKRQDMRRLHAALRFPPILMLDNGCLMDSNMGLCILLRRLAFPNRLAELVPVFRRDRSIISRGFHATLNHIMENFGHTLQLTPENTSKERLDKYCDAIYRKCGALERCFGFIDGTVVGIARPGKDQEKSYNGHKRKHGLKFQSVTTPDGLLRDFDGPYEGLRHDSAILTQSNVLERIRTITETHGDVCYAYGDPAYPISPFIITGFKGNQLTVEQSIFNREMSAVRISVEWGFAILKSKWGFINLPEEMKLFLNCPGKIVMVSAILTNAYTCLYGNQLSVVFNCDPPTLEEYLV